MPEGTIKKLTSKGFGFIDTEKGASTLRKLKRLRIGGHGQVPVLTQTMDRGSDR